MQSNIRVTADKNYLYVDIEIPRSSVEHILAKDNWYGDVAEWVHTCIKQLQARGKEARESSQAPEDET